MLVPPMYHMVLHTYRSWNADHPKGYVQRDVPGVQAPNAALADQRNANAAEVPVLLSQAALEAAVKLLPEICNGYGYEPVGVEATVNHLHVIVTLLNGEDPEMVHGKIKGRLSFEFSKRHLMPRGKKFSRGGNPLEVRDEAHLRQLLSHYLPEHNGIFWVSEKWEYLAPAWWRQRPRR